LGTADWGLDMGIQVSGLAFHPTIYSCIATVWICSSRTCRRWFV